MPPTSTLGTMQPVPPWLFGCALTAPLLSTHWIQTLLCLFLKAQTEVWWE